MRDGVVLILRELGRVAENNGLVEIAPGPGDAFNPDHHQAMSVIEADGIAPHAVADRKSTRELQSLMRISYAVFCLKKKKTKKNHENYGAIQSKRQDILTMKCTRYKHN